MAVNFNVSVTDTVGGYGGYASLIITNTAYAGSVWAASIFSDASIEVRVEITHVASDTGNGGFLASAFRQSVDGFDYWIAGTVYELTTGLDPNGATADIIIRVDPDFIDNWLYFDPNPSPTSSVPADRVDAVNFFEHELGHGLGIAGFLDWNTAQPLSNDLATFDTYVTMIAGVPHFTGPQAQSVYGGPVPLTIGNLYHVGNSAGAPGSDLLNDLMNGVSGQLGKSPGPSALDRAILADIGVPTSPASPLAAWSIQDIGDFNADGKSDILWRHANGTTVVWLMNGASKLADVNLNMISTSWHVQGTGDFNGDGKSDILWRHSGGTTVVWLMDGATKLADVNLNAISTTWQIQNVGDFNGDGKSDILWRHNNGTAVIWLMDGATKLADANLNAIPTSWHISGIGDFNGDGKSDIVWRHDNGTTVIWAMNGATKVFDLNLNFIPNDWRIQGTGDFNGDGKSDILWRHNNGTTVVWLMDSATKLADVNLNEIPTTWHIHATGDFNGDTKSDILWRQDNGTTVMWQMDGATKLSDANLSGFPAPTSIVEPHYDLA